VCLKEVYDLVLNKIMLQHARCKSKDLERQVAKRKVGFLWPSKIPNDAVEFSVFFTSFSVQYNVYITAWLPKLEPADQLGPH
jgi:hypothetical protein